jgi:tetratricopeptide (TPR) repeat protein
LPVELNAVTEIACWRARLGTEWLYRAATARERFRQTNFSHLLLVFFLSLLAVCASYAQTAFQIQKAAVQSLLDRHEWSKAIDAASALHKLVPDDIEIHGFLAEAYSELGNYPEAVKETQWMLNLRPGNPAGLTRGAILREIHGDIPGALAWLRLAYDATPPDQPVARAALLTRIERLRQRASVPVNLGPNSAPVPVPVHEVSPLQ